MSDEPRPLPWKNILIAVLLAVIVVQAWQSRAPKPAPDERPAETARATPGGQVREFTADMGQNALLLVFDTPYGTVEGPVEEGRLPLTLAPEIPGQWAWISAYALRFSPEQGLPAGTAFEVRLDPAALPREQPPLAEPHRLTAATPPFVVTDMRLAETDVTTDAVVRARLAGRVRFSHEVRPQDFLEHVRLIDPAKPGEPVPLSLTTGYVSNEISFVTERLRKTTEPRDLVLTVGKELSPVNGGALGQDMTLTRPFGIDPVLRLMGAAPVERGATAFSLRLDFSAPVSPDQARSLISVSPAVAFTLRGRADESLTLEGPFAPGARYTVSVSPGLSALDGARAESPLSVEVAVPDLTARAAFADPGLYLTARGAETLRIEAVNADQAQLSIDRIHANNLFYALATQGYDLLRDEGWSGAIARVLGDRIVEEWITLPKTRNTLHHVPLALGERIGKERPGLYRVQVNLPGQWRVSQRYVCITDIGLTAKRADDDILVWTARFSNLAPAAGTRLTVLSDQNQVLAEGAAGPDGLWRATLPKNDDGRATPFVVLARAPQGDDFSFLLFDATRADTQGLDTGGALLPPSGLRAFVFGERDIYRPGETARTALILRGRDLNAPPPVPLAVSVADPRGREAYARTVTTDEAGWAFLDLALPGSAATGPFTMAVRAGEDVVGEYRFQVEEFVPDRIRVEVDAPGEAAPGAEIPLAVRAAWLFGPPAASLPVEVRARIEARPFAPKGFEGFAFGRLEGEFEPREIFAEEGSLDEDGAFTARLRLPGGLTPPAALTLTVAGRVREQGGRGVTAARAVAVHAYPAYPGLGVPGREGFAPGAEVALPFVWITPDGGTAPDAELTAQLVEERWQTVLRRAADGSLRYVSVSDPRVVQTRQVRAVDGKGSLSFVPPGLGGYRIALGDPASGAAAETRFWVSGAGFGAWATSDGARVEIMADKKDYRPGETAVFQLRSPFPGKALVTLERDAVLRHQVVDMPGNTAEVRFVLDEEHAPNVYVTAVVVRKVGDIAPGEPGRAFGSTPVNVSREARRLAVSTEAPELSRPGTRLEATAKTAPGARLTLAVVDEGVLRLISQKTPDPFAYFLAKRGLDVESFDIFSLLFPEPRGNRARPGGGISDDESRYTGSAPIRRSRPVTFFSGPLTADASGLARFAVDLPEDFQGALRIMAVAAHEGRFGSSETAARVKSPLVLLPSFPRFLATGDTALAAVTLRNDTGRAGEFSVRLAAEGAAEVENPAFTLSLPEGGEGLALFTLRAGDKEGEIDLRVTAEGNGETSRASETLAVRAKSPPVTSVSGRALEAAETELIAPDMSPDVGPITPGSLRRELTIGNQPLLRFGGQLERLLRYPYGCAEQTVSAAFPLLRFEDLAQTLAPHLFADASPKAMVQQAIARLGTMQADDGGFAMWPAFGSGWSGAPSSEPYVSVYAAHFLVAADRLGFAVQPGLLGPALDYVGRQARGSGTGASALRVRAYACFVLAQAGRPERGVMDALRERHLAAMPPDARALLAASYALVGEAEQARGAAAFGDPVFTAARESGGDLDSPVRARALTLLGLSYSVPDDPRLAPLATDLSARLSADAWFTTQETALGFMALGHYLGQRREAGSFAGEVILPDGSRHAVSSDKTVTLRDIRGDGPIVVRLDEGFSPGAALISLRATAAPTGPLPPESQGLSVARAFLDREGNPVDLAAVRQGDLVVVRTEVASQSGRVDNVALLSLLPAGFEVENPRLTSTERLPWMETLSDPLWQDLRDDRTAVFASITAEKPLTVYTLLRAVTAGEFAVPAPLAEAMYDPGVYARGEAGRLSVTRGQ